MTVAPARRCAFRVIRRVFEQRAYADRALHGEARALGRRDRALATRLAYGTVQRRGTLDHLIEQLTDRPLERLDAAVLAALRLGLYELVYMGGAPDRAVVADAVELAKEASRGGSGLVNAALRRATLEAAALLAGLADDTPEGAARAHSHPRWLAELWFEQLGPAAARALMAADNQPAEAALRANALVNDAAELAELLPVAARLDEQIPEALVLEEAFDAHGSPLWAQGRFMPQSRAAMLVSHALAPRPGERILDLCAAPGGKTTHVAALMRGRGEVRAVERHRGRATALERTCRRMHAAQVRVEVADAAALRTVESFDRVLVDPPCSGLGTLQARPDLRWRATPRTIRGLAAEQAAILDAAARAVRRDGGLVYATCTISAAENERQILAFLDSHPDFSLEEPTGALAHHRHPSDPRFALTLPHRDQTAGFFVARLRRGG
jgi:16S rRNA (cytosine967-C5)-methyltransferase